MLFDFAVARYNPDGTPDNTSTPGKVLTNFGGALRGPLWPSTR
jgi:hypothetical protein